MKRGIKNRRLAFIRSREASKKRNYKKCPDCGLYGCVCQMTLPDTIEEIEIKTEDWLSRLSRINKKKKLMRKIKNK